MKHLAILLFACFSLCLPKHAQCDLVLTDVNIEAGTFTIDFINTTNCGGAGGPDGISEIQIGFQALDPNNDCAAMNQGWDFPSGFSLNDNSNHPGWIYTSTSNEWATNWTNLYEDSVDPPYYAGETVTFPLFNQYQSDCEDGPYAGQMACELENVLTYWDDEGYSIQAVIWQISYGPTMYAEDGGWAEVGANGDGTSYGSGLYEDSNFEDNWVIVGPCADPNPGPDAVIGADVEFVLGCIGGVPAYSITYTVYNLGDEEITDYCIELWNEDYYQCFSDELFGSYGIPVGEGQQFTSPFFEFNGNPGTFFVMSVDSVNDEIVTGNNNTVVYFPDEDAWPECPEVCEPDTVEIETITYIYQVDSIFITDTVIDTLIEYVDNYIYDTVYVDNYVYLTDTVYEYITEYVTEYVTDTVYEYITEYITDTLYITETEYIVDTLYITEYVTDTIYITETEYLTDTLYITEYITDTLIIDNYIYLTDTVTEYVVQEIWIDCETGLPCDEDPPGLDCPDWTSIYAPNVFTPNNDGINDVWLLKYDLGCWEDVEFWIYNRWGVEIYHAYGDSFDGYPYWDGSVQGGDYYVSDAVYMYTFKGKKIGRTDVIQESGHITILR